MLSYRHSFHAGNFADVIKHIVLVEILEHLCRKEAPFDYIDTHAGAGVFDLGSEQASKLQEHLQGVAKLKPADWPELARYFEILADYNSAGALDFYPGSPLIAQKFLRSKDHAWLFELHPADFELLQQNTTHDRRMRIKQEDGFKALLSLLPPQSRRALVLIDPSYEIKTDYTHVVDTVTKAWKKFATGIFAIWYPVVERGRIDEFEAKFVNSGIRDIQRFELGISADSESRGLSAAGVIVVNPPWPLMGKMSALLPRLSAMLGKEGHASFKADVLVKEI